MGLKKQFLDRFRKQRITNSVQEPQKAAESLQTVGIEELVQQLPDSSRGNAILGIFKRGKATSDSLFSQALGLLKESPDYEPYGSAKLALEYGRINEAVGIYCEKKLYASAIDVLLDNQQLEEAEKLFPKLSESEGFFRIGKVYEKAGDLASQQNKMDIRNDLYRRALGEYRKKEFVDDEVCLAEKLGFPNLVIEAYLHSAESSKENMRNMLYFYEKAGDFAASRGDREKAHEIFTKAIERFIELNQIESNKFFINIYFEDARRLVRKLETPLTEQLFLEKMGYHASAASIAEERGDLQEALRLYLVSKAYTPAASLARKLKLPQAVDFYLKDGNTVEAFHIAYELRMYEKAKELGEKIISANHYGDKEKYYKILCSIARDSFEKGKSPKEDFENLTIEAEHYCAKKGKFSDAADFTLLRGDKKSTEIYKKLSDFSS